MIVLVIIVAVVIVLVVIVEVVIVLVVIVAVVIVVIWSSEKTFVSRCKTVSYFPSSLPPSPTGPTLTQGKSYGGPGAKGQLDPFLPSLIGSGYIRKRPTPIHTNIRHLRASYKLIITCGIL